MLGRRQLREKAMQAIYAWKISGEETSERIIEKNMLKGVDQIYDLYVYLLNLVKFQKAIAENKVELAKNRQLATEEDLNPNLKFVNNPIFRILEENEELNEYTSKNRQLDWDMLETYPVNIFKNITQSPEYEKYMKDEKSAFNADRDFVIKIFEKFIADNEGLSDWMEEKNIHWADDMHIANSMVSVTLKSFVPKSDGSLKLFKVYKDDDDRDFVINLFRRTIRYSDETLEIINEKAKNWELERIAIMDLILLQMALTEFYYFPSIPPKVTLNEYIELSKTYSTEKSNVFINGILDRSLREMKKEE